ncbi:AraC family transcriptional regulator [Leptospira weilii serovar Heyan]|nr:AraC family transcriptional regulator [Leptospira weilii serovar Heyan]
MSRHKFRSFSSFHRACIKFTGKSPNNLKKELQLNIDTYNKAEKQSDL